MPHHSNGMTDNSHRDDTGALAGSVATYEEPGNHDRFALPAHTVGESGGQLPPSERWAGMWGGVTVVLGGRESRLHGEGSQHRQQQRNEQEETDT